MGAWHFANAPFLLKGGSFMKYKTYSKGDFKVIKLNEVLGLNSDISELEDVVNDLLMKKYLNIAIHFKDNSFLYSHLATVLVLCLEKIKDEKGTLALININEDIQNFLRVIDFESAIKIFKSEEELEFQEQTK